MPSISPADPPMSDKSIFHGYASTSFKTLDGNSDNPTRNLTSSLEFKHVLI